MSSAIVFVPAAAQAFFPGLATATAATGIGVPIVLASAAAIVLLGASARHFSSCSTDWTPEARTSIDQLVRRVEIDLRDAVDHIKARAEKLNLTEKGRKNLAAEIAFLTTTQLPKLLSEFRSGTLTESGVNTLRDQMQNLEFLLAQQKASLVENRKRGEFLARRIEKAIVKTQEKFAGKLKQKALDERLKNTLTIPDDELEKRVEELGTFLGELESLSSGLVMDDVVERICGKRPAIGKARGKTPGAPPPSSAQNDEFERQARLQTLKNDIAYYTEKMKAEYPAFLDAATERLVQGAAAAESLQRIQAVRDQVKLLYQKCASATLLAEYFREKLEEYAQVTADDPVAAEFRAAARKSLVEREEFVSLSLKFEEFLNRRLEDQQHQVVEGKVRQALQKLDYVVVEPEAEAELSKKLIEARMVVLDTKHDDYKVLLRFGRDEVLSVRLIRVVESERERENINDFQRQKDRDVKGEWCKNADLLRDHLHSLGMLMTERVRMEDDVQYLTIEQLELQNIDVSTLKKKKTGAGKKKALSSRPPSPSTTT